MKNNYPIKYAIMPLYEQDGWNHGLNQLERNFEVVAYIVSKCYVLSENKKYSDDGTFKMDYEVVFPYEKEDSSLNTWSRITPSLNFYGQSTNSVIVDDIFDNYQDALKIADLQNHSIIDKRIGMLSYHEKLDEEIEKLKQKHNDLIKKYRELEAQIEKYTNDLQLNEVPKEQSIIVMYPDKDSILNISIYNFINLYINDLFYVCNVSKEDYELMKKQIKETGMLDERSINFENTEYHMNRYLLANDLNKKIIRITDCDSKEEKGYFYLSNGNMYYDETMYKFDKDPIFERCDHGIKVYTIETYSDIIKSYIQNYVSNDIDIEVDNTIVKKRLVLK